MLEFGRRFVMQTPSIIEDETKDGTFALLSKIERIEIDEPAILNGSANPLMIVSLAHPIKRTGRECDIHDVSVYFYDIARLFSFSFVFHICVTSRQIFIHRGDWNNSEVYTFCQIIRALSAQFSWQITETHEETIQHSQFIFDPVSLEPVV